MKKVFLEISKWIILIVLPLTSYSQKEKVSESTSRKINYDEYTEAISFSSTQKQVKVQEDLVYYWFDGIETHKTQGDYVKYLLHGDYVVYYLNRNLSIKGSFRNGLKDKTWKYWRKDGVLKKIETWNNGKLDGKVTHYNHLGIDSLEYKYNNNKLKNKAVLIINFKRHKVKVDRIDEFYNKQKEKEDKKNNRKSKKIEKQKKESKPNVVDNENEKSKKRWIFFKGKKNKENGDVDKQDLDQESKKSKKDNKESSKNDDAEKDDNNFWQKISPKNWFTFKNKKNESSQN